MEFLILGFEGHSNTYILFSKYLQKPTLYLSRYVFHLIYRFKFDFFFRHSKIWNSTKWRKLHTKRLKEKNYLKKSGETQLIFSQSILAICLGGIFSNPLKSLYLSFKINVDSCITVTYSIY